MVHECGDCRDTHKLEGKYANYFKVGHNAEERKRRTVMLKEQIRRFLGLNVSR